MGNSKDCAIAEPNIKPYFNIRSVQCLLPRNRMNGVTSSDNISVLVYTMACLAGLGLHATMDSEAADGKFKYTSILFNIILNIITNICFKYYY